MVIRTKFLFFLLLFTGCKYENGPLFSLVSIPNRITGDYHIESVTENGADKIAEIEALNIDYLHFDDDNSISYGNGTFAAYYTDTTKSKLTSWSLINPEKVNLFIGLFGCSSYPTIPVEYHPIPGFVSDGTCSSGGDVLWKLTKLSNSKMWLQTDFMDSHIEVHLKKIK